MKSGKNGEVEQILIGGLLGDGAVYKRSKNTAYYSEVHSIKQRGYTSWKNVRLGKLLRTKTRIYNQYEKQQMKYYKKISIHSKSLPELVPYRNLFYPFGKKVVTKDILNRVNELGLTVWYCDDGSYHFTQKVVRLMTDSFSYNEQVIIKKWFKEKWKLKCAISKRKTGSFYLNFNVSESEKFLNIIKDYMPHPMIYKLGHLWDGNNIKIKAALRKDSLLKKKHYIENKERILRRQKEYRNNEDVKKRERIVKQIYYQKNKERILERCKRYQERQKESITRREKEYRNKNAARISERKKLYYVENREKILKRQSDYNKKSEIKERKKLYDKERYLRRGVTNTVRKKT